MKKSEYEIVNVLKKEYPIPAPKKIAEIIVNRKIKSLSSEEIKNNFDRLVDELQVEAYTEYLNLEKQSGRKVVKTYFRNITKEKKIESPHEAFDVVAHHFESLDKLFLSLSQSRKARAGSTFEYIIISLFRRLDYPFSYRPVINGEPDFILPSKEHFKKFSAECIIFTVKRTLRERWRQIVTEGTRGLGFYLATIDDAVTSNQLNEMKKNRIYLVVPERLKRQKYANRINVVSFIDFFENYLDPAMIRWKKGKII